MPSTLLIAYGDAGMTLAANLRGAERIELEPTEGLVLTFQYRMPPVYSSLMGMTLAANRICVHPTCRTRPRQGLDPTRLRYKMAFPSGYSTYPIRCVTMGPTGPYMESCGKQL